MAVFDMAPVARHELQFETEHGQYAKRSPELYRGLPMLEFGDKAIAHPGQCSQLVLPEAGTTAVRPDCPAKTQSIHLMTIRD
jgi:hypothetical protein